MKKKISIQIQALIDLIFGLFKNFFVQNRSLKMKVKHSESKPSGVHFTLTSFRGRGFDWCLFFFVV